MAHEAMSSHGQSQILRLQSGALRDSRQCGRSDLNIVVECEYEIRHARSRQNLVGACLALQRPTHPEQGGENPTCFRARPRTHAAAKEMLRSSGPASPCSRRSATILSASAWTFALASSAEAPYA